MEKTMDLERVMAQEHAFIAQVDSLGLNSILIDGIKLIFEKLKDGKT
jgi:hypothetical protein